MLLFTAGRLLFDSHDVVSVLRAAGADDSEWSCYFVTHSTAAFELHLHNSHGVEFSWRPVRHVALATPPSTSTRAHTNTHKHSCTAPSSVTAEEMHGETIRNWMQSVLFTLHVLLNLILLHSSLQRQRGKKKAIWVLPSKFCVSESMGVLSAKRLLHGK